jgi:hypothetical protein
MSIWDISSLYSITLNGESILNREHNVRDVKRFIDFYKSKVEKIKIYINIFLIKLCEYKDHIDEADVVDEINCLENTARYRDLYDDFNLIENFLNNIEEVNNNCNERRETDTDDIIRQDRRRGRLL